MDQCVMYLIGGLGNNDKMDRIGGKYTFFLSLGAFKGRI